MTASVSVAEQPAPWWTRVPAEPAAVPEWLAQAAVERLGGSAARYLRWLRDTYPYATPDGLARAATERFSRRPWYTGLAGPFGLGALLSAQAELVLHIAAAYGRDPADPARVPELVALIRPRGLAASAASRFAGRLLPGAGLVFGVIADRSALDQVIRRAIAYYRTGST